MSSAFLLLGKCSAVPRIGAVYIADGMDKPLDIFADLARASVPHAYQIVAALVWPVTNRLFDPSSPSHRSADPRTTLTVLCGRRPVVLPALLVLEAVGPPRRLTTNDAWKVEADACKRIAWPSVCIRMTSGRK